MYSASSSSLEVCANHVGRLYDVGEPRGLAAQRLKNSTFPSPGWHGHRAALVCSATGARPRLSREGRLVPSCIEDELRCQPLWLIVFGRSSYAKIEQLDPAC